jgi:hypothetical protein
MDHLDKEVIESLSEPAKRVFESLDYRSKQRMLKKAREMAKTEKMKRRKKSRFKKKGLLGFGLSQSHNFGCFIVIVTVEVCFSSDAMVLIGASEVVTSFSLLS